MESIPTKIPPVLANGRFEILERLGAGRFGAVYRGFDAGTQAEVAVKFEGGGCSAPLLKHEAEVLVQLSCGKVQAQGIARYLYFFQEAGVQCLVTEVLGWSLLDRLQACGGHLMLRTVVLVADQLLRVLEFLHSRSLVHRDVKPENLVFGVLGKRHHLHLVDLGLSKLYFKEKRHVQLRQCAGLTGTARYCSLNAQRGVEHGRRDDLEAAGFVLVFLLRGTLPWQGVKARSVGEQHRRIREVKEATRFGDLCRGLPKELELYLGYCRGLLFAERPDYRMLRGLFLAVRARLGKLRGRPLKDHHLEWLEGKGSRHMSAVKLVPLRPHENLAQPDDPVPNRLKVRWQSLVSFSGPFGKSAVCTI